MAHKDELGRQGEQLAARYLTDRGYRIVERNWRCSYGELDIIAERGGRIAIVEVKTRSSTAYGHPFEAITPVKAARLRRLASLWCDEHGRTLREVRIDAIAVLLSSGAPPEQAVVEHLEGVC
jgi:putative endonuclease